MAAFLQKLQWAEHHFQTLEDQISAWQESGGYGLVAEFDPKTEEHTVWLKAETPPPVLPLIIGDALHEMRSALDQLAYALAETFSILLEPAVAKRVEFPIFGDREMSAKERDSKLGALDPGAAAVIEGLQPCRRGDRYAEDALWHLHELANTDRHRLLHLTFARWGGFGLGGSNLRIQTISGGIIGPTLEHGAELGRFKITPIDPSQPVHMNLDTPPGIAFQEGFLAGKPVLDTLRGIHEHITTNVVPPLVPFLPAAYTEIDHM